MIVLEEEHYMGHVKDHPKDAKFLDVPIENRKQMAIIFGNGQATGRFAMGSNEALGNPANLADSGLGPLDGTIGDGIAAEPSGVGGEVHETAARASGVGPCGEEFAAMNDLIGGSNPDKKRKRTSALLNEGEGALISNMTDSVNNVAAAILATTHTEVHPDLCKSVMDLPGFSEDQLDLVLAYLTKDKAESLVYIQKDEARRGCWFRKFLDEHHPNSI
ncbi:hypothetical protein E2562_022292 [Oryza meyeriana var. granulata]|uniref:Uncharacterized protein n=1 Tax=Oryza meyeriana var. granulata TaxID=110450 RepID=A0A6G1D6B9_9ORYZ|nr:hypothetical protein E2562_022292 [Oryza meyeriana var. granulata]